MRQKINRREADLFPGFAGAGESFSMLKQYTSNRSYASHQEHHANLRLLDFANHSQLRQTRLERAEHVLQLGELAGAVAPGDGGADRLSPPAVRSDDVLPGCAESAKGSGPAGKQRARVP